MEKCLSILIYTKKSILLTTHLYTVRPKKYKMVADDKSSFSHNILHFEHHFRFDCISQQQKSFSPALLYKQCAAITHHVMNDIINSYKVRHVLFFF